MFREENPIHYFRNEIYQLNVPMEEPCFIYIRAYIDDEVRFSVLDHATEYPDFNECGVFTVSRNDFFAHMVPLEN